MSRTTSRSSYLDPDRPIVGETHVLRRTEMMPYGGYKNTRVTEKKITLAWTPPPKGSPDPDT